MATGSPQPGSAPQSQPVSAPSAAPNHAPQQAPALTEVQQKASSLQKRNELRRQVLEREEKLKSDIDRKNQDIKAAEKLIADTFKGRLGNFKTSQAKMAAEIVLHMLQYPLRSLSEEWEKDFREGKGTYGDLEKRIKQITESARLYLAKITDDSSGTIDGEKLAELAFSARSNAQNFARLMASSDPIIRNELMAVIGLQGDSASAPENFKEAKARLPEEIQYWLNRGEKGLMPCLWMLLAEMPKADKMDISKTFIAQNPAQKDFFVLEGNKFGAFSPNEMEQLSGKSYTAEQREQYGTYWEMQNGFREKGRQLARSSIGSTNYANENITLLNGLKLAGKVVAGTTVALNLGLGIWKGEGWKRPGRMVQLLTTPHMLGAAGAYALIKKSETDEPFREILIPSGDEAQADARMVVKNKLNGSLGDQWREFFATEDYAGLQYFTAFNDTLKKDDKLNEEKYDPLAFIEFLNKQKEDKSNNLPPADLDKIANSFMGLDDDALLSMAVSLNVLGIHGNQQAKTKYEETLKELEA